MGDKSESVPLLMDTDGNGSSRVRGHDGNERDSWQSPSSSPNGSMKENQTANSAITHATSSFGSRGSSALGSSNNIHNMSRNRRESVEQDDDDGGNDGDYMTIHGVPDPSVSDHPVSYQNNHVGSDDDAQTRTITTSQFRALNRRRRKRRFSWKTTRKYLQRFMLLGLLGLAAVAFALTEETDDGHLYNIEPSVPTQISLSSSRKVIDATFRVGNSTGIGNLTIAVIDRDGHRTVADNIPLEGTSFSNPILRRFHLSAAPDLMAIATTDVAVPIELQIQYTSSIVRYEVLFAGVILIVVYVLIIFELIHRALAAMLGSFIAIGVLSVLGKQPSLDTIVGWIDYETLMLLFGMMVIVEIMKETGVFEYTAVKAYRLSKGNVWPLIYLLCFISAFVSAFLDNVTTILLLTPITIEMCKKIYINPIPVLLAEVLFSNIGGTATAIGDPPNVIIVSSDWSADGVGDIQFTEFTGHMFLGIIFVAAVCFWALRFLIKAKDLDVVDPPRIIELKREIAVWTNAKKRMNFDATDEREVINLLQSKIDRCESEIASVTEKTLKRPFHIRLAEMEAACTIKNKDLLWNASIVLFVVIVMFFVHSAPSIHLDLGWIAVLGAICLLLLSGETGMDELLVKIEWGTLIFFAALFILMEALTELGLISFIGNQTSTMVEQVPEHSRLSVSLILILWVSAIASSFIDNIPFTTAMIPVIKELAADPKVNLPLRPLVWALAFGACLGGNGTLIGASANVVCAGLAEKDGYTISFNRFFKIGFPMMLISTTIAMFYLLICHSAIGWNES